MIWNRASWLVAMGTMLREITWAAWLTKAGMASYSSRCCWCLLLWCICPDCPGCSLMGEELMLVTLRWRHNDHDSVSNHQPHGCLLNRLFRRRSKKTSKLRVTGLCAGNSPVPVNSPHKGPVTRKMFPFDDVIMRRILQYMHLLFWLYPLQFLLIDWLIVWTRLHRLFWWPFFPFWQVWNICFVFGFWAESADHVWLICLFYSGFCR